MQASEELSLAERASAGRGSRGPVASDVWREQARTGGSSGHSRLWLMDNDIGTQNDNFENKKLYLQESAKNNEANFPIGIGNR